MTYNNHWNSSNMISHTLPGASSTSKNNLCLLRAPASGCGSLYTADASGKGGSKYYLLLLFYSPFHSPAQLYLMSYSAPVAARCEKIQDIHKHTTSSSGVHGTCPEDSTQVFCPHATLVHSDRSRTGRAGLFRFMLSPLLINKNFGHKLIWQEEALSILFLRSTLHL